jgi:hypothetical protein
MMGMAETQPVHESDSMQRRSFGRGGGGDSIDQAQTPGRVKAWCDYKSLGWL